MIPEMTNSSAELPVFDSEVAQDFLNDLNQKLISNSFTLVLRELSTLTACKNYVRVPSHCRADVSLSVAPPVAVSPRY